MGMGKMIKVTKGNLEKKDIDKEIKRVFNEEIQKPPTQRSGRIPGQPFPRTKRAKLKYAYCPTSAPSSALGIYTQINQFRLNSIYDPDLTGAGSTAALYSQLAAIYRRYRVWNTKVRLHVMGYSGVNAVVTLVPRNDAALGSSLVTDMQTPYSKYVQVNTYGDEKILKLDLDLPKFNGSTAIEYVDDRFASTMLNSPVEEMNFTIAVGGLSGAGTQVTWFLEIEYDTEFFDPIVLNS